ncbi:uncharacterized protein ACIB01_017668 [Guaruba guarouba]
MIPPALLALHSPKATGATSPQLLRSDGCFKGQRQFSFLKRLRSPHRAAKTPIPVTALPAGREFRVKLYRTRDPCLCLPELLSSTNASVRALAFKTRAFEAKQ